MCNVSRIKIVKWNVGHVFYWQSDVLRRTYVAREVRFSSPRLKSVECGRLVSFSFTIMFFMKWCPWLNTNILKSSSIERVASAPAWLLGEAAVLLAAGWAGRGGAGLWLAHCWAERGWDWLVDMCQIYASGSFKNPRSFDDFIFCKSDVLTFCDQLRFWGGVCCDCDRAIEFK